MCYVMCHSVCLSVSDLGLWYHQLIMNFDISFSCSDALFSSSHERRFLGFKLLESLLPTLSVSEVCVVFSPNLLSCLLNNLWTKDNYLHQAARHSVCVCVCVHAHTHAHACLCATIVMVGRGIICITFYCSYHVYVPSSSPLLTMSYCSLCTFIYREGKMVYVIGAIFVS